MPFIRWSLFRFSCCFLTVEGWLFVLVYGLSDFVDRPIGVTTFIESIFDVCFFCLFILLFGNDVVTPVE